MSENLGTRGGSGLRESMWTNVFKIGGLQLITWFQFLPYEPDPSSLPEKTHKSDERDPATLSVLSSHLQLQKEGFLSTCTNSFVGPWDPSQGVHNPDEKIKLWVFLPGCHSSVSESAHAAVSCLRVIASGVWSAPGDSEEVALALSQCLKNRIERSLRALSYLRFGDVFTKCHPFSSSGKNFRRMQPACEFVFTATEDAIFVHVIVSAKHIRGLPGDDVKRALKYHSFAKNRGLPVICAPNGLRGRLIGVCPADLVKQVYLSKVKAANGFSALETPFSFSPFSSCRSKGQNCYVEVAAGSTSISGQNPGKNATHFPADDNRLGFSEGFSNLDRTLIYPVEAVLVPVLYKTISKPSPKSFWQQNRAEAMFSDVWTLWDSSDSSSSYSLGLESVALVESMTDASVESALKPHQRYNSSSNSNDSSLSSISSTSSGSENATAIGTHDLEADADSVRCMQSGLSRQELMESNARKMTSKRPRAGMTESNDQATAMQETYKSEFSVVEANSSAAMSATHNGVGSYWDLADDDGDYGINIQSLLSEFGDFSDFFINESLCFGEPPGTAESQALILAADFGEGNGSPYTVGIDAQDQSLLPMGFSSFESLSQVPVTKLEGPNHKHIDNLRGLMSVHDDAKFSTFSKAEAMMTFALAYAAIDTSICELSMPTFRNAYLPNSRKDKSSESPSLGYFYNATPPPLVAPLEEKSEVSVKGSPAISSSSYYTLVQRGNRQYDKNIVHIDEDLYSHKEDTTSSISGITSSLSHVQGKKTESILEAGNILLSCKASLATDADCMMLQASMCRIRHTLSSIVKQNKVSGTRNELRSKDSIPVRIAGDIDDGPIGKPVHSPVGVWRSVGAIKDTKSLSTMKNGEKTLSMLQNTSVNESSSINIQAHPLQMLLDALPLVVQQSTSFVDIALDSNDGEEPYVWLALKEQQRRGFSCGPLMAHAGCGGLLAACHSMDIAGIGLNDPLSADVHASFVASFLQSDVKVALKNAFGNLEGPLCLTDWCKGRNQASDSAAVSDGFSVDSIVTEMRDSSSITLRGESISPPQALSACSSLLKDKSAVDESLQRRTYQDASNPELEQLNSNPRWATISLIPFPAFLVGYQDDWLKTSSSSIELWEKGPLEPYALPKPMTYYAICPDIDILSSAAIDFFLQLGTVYETCKLGTHSPHGSGGQMDQNPGRTSSGLVLVDCPQSLKSASNNILSITSVSEFFVALDSSWDLKSYLKSLAKTLKNLKLSSSSTTNHKESKGGPSLVVYVVCPFPEPTAVLQTIVEASTALGSNYFSSDRSRRSFLHAQVMKALNYSSSSDEASVSNVFTLSGFNISKLVLQIITVDSLLRVKAGNELAMLKEYAFTVYNKARRIPRSFPANGALWKESLDPRWEGSSWQTLRSLDGSLPQQEEARFLFEPLFILSESSLVEQGVSNLPSPREDLSTSGGGGLAVDEEGKAASLHCCYGWTEDWRWLVCIWTDSRGELLDSQVIPFDGISGRQDTKFLQCLFVQILNHGCHLLSSSSSDSGAFRPRDLVVSRIGSFFELERQEWQKAIYLVGGSEVKKWGMQLRGGASSTQQEGVGGMAERALPSSPSPLYSPQAKMGYAKTGATPPVNAKKPLLFQFVQSITLVAVLVDHSLQLMLPAADPPSSGYVEGFSPVKSLGSIPGAYIITPSLSLHHLPTTPLQLPTSLTSESPPLAHLLHSKGPSIPLTSAFVVSKSTDAADITTGGSTKEEWPSILLVSLVDHFRNSHDHKLRHSKQAETSSVLETVAAELYSLSWLTVSPVHLCRRTPLPFHCDMLLRLRRLLHYTDQELLSRPSDSSSP